jgi:hypothetical protein
MYRKNTRIGQTSINKNVLTHMHVQCLALADSHRVGEHYRHTSLPQHRSRLHHKLEKTSAHEVRRTLIATWKADT